MMIPTWQTVKNAEECMLALAVYEAKGHRAVVDKALAKARSVAAEVTADGRSTSAVEVLALFIRDAIRTGDVLAVYLSAALAVELGLTPDETARAEAQALLERARQEGVENGVENGVETTRRAPPPTV